MVKYADCSLKSGNLQEAKTYYQKARDIKPDDPRINTLLFQLDPDVGQTNVTLRLAQRNYNHAKLVTVAGDFNHWNPMMYPFLKQHGAWVCHLKLEPGKYHYKFIVDGVAILDPENPSVAMDDNNTHHSVLIVE